MRRVELKFQDHVLKSYAIHGGHAEKWATQMTVGRPDIVGTLPRQSAHLCEVKHRPEWGLNVTYKNPLTPKQKQVLSRFSAGGAKVYGMVIVGSTEAIGSYLCLFDPLSTELSTNVYVPYTRGQKYDLPKLMETYHGQTRTNA